MESCTTRLRALSGAIRIFPLPKPYSGRISHTLSDQFVTIHRAPAPVRSAFYVASKVAIRNVPIVLTNRTSSSSVNTDPHRSICTQTELTAEEWPEHEFVKIAEACLEYVMETVSEFGYKAKSELSDFDTEFSQGVLTISFGDQGTYVLNTQTPNRQIWMSSPTSGPWRYAWNHKERQWISTRDGHALSSRLSDELSVIFREPIVICFEHGSFED